ncbi:MAG: adenylosuccinate lyase [Acidobacteriota bacterium]|nr:MAG: adenylosuccinate lyase [Acidobacteriota bacterium]
MLTDRYVHPEMGRVWSEEAKFDAWMEVETAAAEVMAEAGIIPQKAAKEIRAKGAYSIERIDAIEKDVKHDVIAFTQAMAENVGDAGRFVHFGLTSYDVVDTALGMRLRDATDLILKNVDALLEVLKARAFDHKRTIMVGRTHGVHAEPMTFGMKLALWYAEMERNRTRLAAARDVVAVGKLSGAVGTFAHLPPDIEEKLCAKLGLKAAPISTQVLQRDRHAEAMSALAITASTLDKIAVEIRSLQRTEIREVEEFFSNKQKGSSAMPHKRNPVASEQISGLARVIRGNLQAALENVPLWNERDISHSSAERMILPSSYILTDHILRRASSVLDNLIVYPETMRANLDSMKGLVFSGQVLLLLAKKGLAREDAYRLVQRNAMAVWRDEGTFRELLGSDEDVRKWLSDDDLDEAFDLEKQMEHIDTIYLRVFGSRS